MMPAMIADILQPAATVVRYSALAESVAPNGLQFCQRPKSKISPRGG
jgi:hypothetical protein